MSQPGAPPAGTQPSAAAKGRRAPGVGLSRAGVRLASAGGRLPPEQRFHQPIAGCLRSLLLLLVQDSALRVPNAFLFFPLRFCEGLTPGPVSRVLLGIGVGAEFIGISAVENEQGALLRPVPDRRPSSLSPGFQG